LFDAYGGYLLYDRTRIDPRSGYPKRAVLSPATVKAHLATLRGRYESILRDNRVRQQLYDLAPGGSPADRKAFVDEFLMRIRNAVHPSNSEIKISKIQDLSDDTHLRLKPDQVKALIRAPGLETLPGLRDTAAIVMMACTGIREAELVALNVDDLQQTMGGELALRVRGGKGRKQRLVPYGPLDWCLLYVDRWLDAAEITSGAVFRGFYKGYKTVRPTRLTERAVNLIMNQYPIPIDGELQAVQPHDLRRTYARNAYEYGMDMERIRQNLGHVSLHTTQTYIGTLDAAQRRPPAMFNPPHRLSDWQRK
jgi:site-specific recombinase XerD